MGYRVFVRDENLNRIGEIDTWISLSFNVRHCLPGSWQLLIKDGTAQADLLDKKCGIAVYQDGIEKPVISGSITTFQRYWTTVQHSGPGSLYVAGNCDNQLLYNRLGFPDPSKTVANQYSASDSRATNGASSFVLWWEIEHSMGASALADRRVAGLNTGTAPSFGDPLNDNLRFDVLGTKAEDWTNNKNIGYRFVWNADTKAIDLDIYQPADKSKEVRFSPDLGNLREYTWTLSAPKATRAIVACQGEGSGRYIYQKIDTTAEAEWGIQAETFVDRRDLPIVTDPATGQPAKATLDVTDEEFNSAKLAVEDAATAALQEGERNGNFQIYPIDTEQVKFGRDYFVGDKVTVAVDGTEYSDIVREVSINVDDGGNTWEVTPTIGEQGSGNPLNLYKTVSEMREKLRRLEARM